VEYFMPPPLARAWDRRLWWGLPALLIERLTGRRGCRRPRPRRMPKSWERGLVEPCSDGAGAVYHCVKTSAVDQAD
jgi:hypothetical protein